jgi:hypothetical protein
MIMVLTILLNERDKMTCTDLMIDRKETVAVQGFCCFDLSFLLLVSNLFSSTLSFLLSFFSLPFLVLVVVLL